MPLPTLLCRSLQAASSFFFLVTFIFLGGHAPSAFATSMPFLRCPPEPQCLSEGELLGVPGALVFASGGPVFVVAAQGTPLDSWLWRPEGLCSSVPWNCTIRVSSWQTSTPGHCRQQRPPYAPFLSVKEADLHVWELWLHMEGIRGAAL